MKKICQLYLPSFDRSYGDESLKKIKELLPELNVIGFSGVYLIALWKDGGADNGFDVVNYVVKSEFGTESDFMEVIGEAHRLNMVVGVDIVPNHVSNQHWLAQNCLNGLPGYEDVLYVVSEEEAEKLTAAGVPSFFGKLAYSRLNDKYVRTTFADYCQVNLNWNSTKVKEYFRGVFKYLDGIGVDFYRIDCGMMLLEDVSKADPNNPMACMRPVESIQAIREVAGGAKLFFEWFDTDARLFEDMSECWALDCSYVMSGVQNIDWYNTSSKLVPLLGGHDQMTIADRGIEPVKAIFQMLSSSSEYGFLDLQTLVGYKTIPTIMPGDEKFDADLKNPNRRYRGRRAIDDVIRLFREMYVK